jgi:hypothetical protein
MGDSAGRLLYFPIASTRKLPNAWSAFMLGTRMNAGRLIHFYGSVTDFQKDFLAAVALNQE